MTTTPPPSRRNVCVFCGSSAGHDPKYLELARHVGRSCASRGLRVVYGGGLVGLMGEVANGALQEGGEVIGVIPRILVEREVAHTGCTAMHIVETMDERKRLMAAQSDCFISLPGAIGTLDELSEMITWTQIGFHRKPSAILNAFGYFDHLLAMFDHMVGEGFWSPAYRDSIVVADEIGALFDRLLTTELTFPAKFAST